MHSYKKINTNYHVKFQIIVTVMIKLCKSNIILLYYVIFIIRKKLKFTLIMKKARISIYHHHPSMGQIPIDINSILDNCSSVRLSIVVEIYPVLFYTLDTYFIFRIFSNYSSYEKHKVYCNKINIKSFMILLTNVALVSKMGDVTD